NLALEETAEGRPGGPPHSNQRRAPVGGPPWAAFLGTERPASTSRPSVSGVDARTAAATRRQRPHPHSNTATKPQNQSASSRAGSRFVATGAGTAIGNAAS